MFLCSWISYSLVPRLSPSFIAVRMRKGRERESLGGFDYVRTLMTRSVSTSVQYIYSYRDITIIMQYIAIHIVMLMLT